MTEPEHLPHAPIVEAVLEIVVSLPASVSQETLAAFQERVKDRYPSRQVRTSWTSQVELKPDSPPVARSSGGPVGYLFTSADGKQVVQVRKDGFAFSRLKPYEDWKTLSVEARHLWHLYVSLTKPEKVNRISLRYLNRMELPLPIVDFKEYLLTGPEIAPKLPQGLSTFFFRVVIPHEQTQAFAIITETIEEADSRKGKLPLILDIDVQRLGSFPTAVDKLWPMFEQLHLLKNQCFFGSITDKAKELFR